MTRVTWNQTIGEFTQHYAVGVSLSTVRLRRLHLRHLAYVLDRSPETVTAADLEWFLSKYGHSPEYRKSLRASVSLFFAWAARVGVVPSNPAADLPAVRVLPGSPRPAPDTALVAALARADQDTRFMLAFARYAGLRRHEIAKVHTDEIGPLLRVEGKGGKVRFVPLHPVLREPLAAHPRGFLFPGRIDGHLSPDAVGRRCSRVLPDGWTLHTLRHKFATECYSADRDLLAVQQLLGHASVETTRIYTLMPSDALTRAVFAAGPESVTDSLFAA